MSTLKDSLSFALGSLMDSVISGFPKLIMLIVLLLVGYIVARVVKMILIKAMNAINLQAMMDKMELSPILSKFGITSVATFIGTVVYWMIMLIVLITAAETINMTMISEGLASIIAYIPKLFSSLVILILGMLLANMIKKIVYAATDSIGLSGAKVISNIVYYVLFIFIVITALSQTGIDTSLITSNVTLIFAAILLAFAISYGFASKDIMTNMLSSFYSRDKFTLGMIVKVNGVTGTIVALDSLSITIQTEGKKVIIPVKTLLSEQVDVLDK